MITINLRPGQKRKRAGSPFAGVAGRAKALGARVKDPLLLAAAAAWIGVVAWLGLVWTTNARQLHALTPRLEQVRVEHRRFKNFIAQKRHQELIRDSLVSQIGVIRTVDGDRYVWPHVMDEVARALPPYTWLTEMAPVSAGGASDSTDSTSASHGLAFKITGRTVDIQAVTRFMRDLEASPFFSGVVLDKSEPMTDNGKEVAQFQLTFGFSRPDTLLLHRAPLSLSVR